MDPSLTLASATAHDLSNLDPSLHDTDPSYLAQEDIDAATAEIINASIRTAAQAHAAAEAAEAVVAEAEAITEADQHPYTTDQLEYRPEDEGITEQSNTSLLPITSSSATKSLYPFIRPQRDDTTPLPLEQVFASKAEFDVWLAEESSWCHYVQRRVTNPEKRAEERAKARDRAYGKKLAEMDPEEAAKQPPIKKRQRNRTSMVVSKTTYTCHHAGKYSSQHNSDLPQEKLRMNTKQSVKCGCLSRVVINQMEDGEIRSAFWWKHNGHDPFADKEAETYRLPQSITDWLLLQFGKGREPEDILQMLNIPEEEKERRIKRAIALASSSSPSSPLPPPLHHPLTAQSDIHPLTAQSDSNTDTPIASGSNITLDSTIPIDPSLSIDETQLSLPEIEDEDLPPIIAYGLQIRYPDLYNRYRKVGPPLRIKKAEEVASGVSSPRGKSTGGLGGGGVKAKRGRKRKVVEGGENENEEGGEDVGEGMEVVNGSGKVSGRGKRNKGKGKEIRVDTMGVIDPTLDLPETSTSTLPDQQIEVDIGHDQEQNEPGTQLYEFTFDDIGVDSSNNTLHHHHDTDTTIPIPEEVDMGRSEEEINHVDMLRAAAVADGEGDDSLNEIKYDDEGGDDDDVSAGAGVGVGVGVGEEGGEGGEDIRGVEGEEGEVGLTEEEAAMDVELQILASEITSGWRT